MIASCREAAAQIAGQVGEEIAGKTTVSVERTVARLLGVDGANELDAPLPNVLVDHVPTAASWARASATGWATRCSTTSAARRSRSREAVDAGQLELCALPRAEDGAIRTRITQRVRARLARSPRACTSAASCASASARARRRCATC